MEAITTNLQRNLSAFPIGPASVPKDVLVENGDAAQRAALPFCIVLFEFGIDGLQEGSYERRLEGRAHDAALVPEVHD